MNILILGGTSFVGRHLAENALSRGHQLTLFHRGKTGEGLFPESEHVLGDRLEDLTALEGRTWDAVIDTSAYLPRAVRMSAFLSKSASRMLFISTISVYDSPPVNGTEAAPVIELEDPTVEVVNGETYGGLKVLCEREIEANWGDRATILRPGLIVGPHDPTDRFTYWVLRALSNEPYVAPPRMDQPIQGIDGRDLAKFGLNSLEQSLTGVFNCVGPESPTTFSDILPASRGHQVKTDVALPMVLDKEHESMFQISHAKAVLAGLTHRPLSATLADTFAWHRERGAPALKVGLSLEQERELLNTQ